MNTIQNQCRTVYKHHKLAVTSSNKKNNSWFQPGGMHTIALGPWASQVIGWGQDKLFGRWSLPQTPWTTWEKSNYCICISSVHPRLWCHLKYNNGTTSTTLQQQAVKDPNPQNQFIMDLVMQIQQWGLQVKILISMDANEDVTSPKSKISHLFEETDLIDLHHYWHPATHKPATHQRGSAPIDMLLGTNLFAMALTAAWILPFGDLPLIKHKPPYL